MLKDQKVTHSIEIRLDDLMKKHRIHSLSSLSSDTNISRDTLYRLKRNKAAGINLDTLEKLCNHFGCEITELLSLRKTC